MSGFHEKGERKYRCSGNMRFGASFCGCNTAREAPILKAVINKLQAELLNPDTIARLRAEVRRQAEQEQEADTEGQLRIRVNTLEKQIDQGNRNLAILPADRLPGVIAKVRELEEERDRVQADLERLTSNQDTNNLEALIACAEQKLWDLRDAVAKNDPATVRAALQEVIDRVELEFDPYGRRSPLVGGTIYLKGEDQSVESSTVRSHMHHGLTALRKYLEPRLNQVQEP
jgi:hypothetical protein